MYQIQIVFQGQAVRMRYLMVLQIVRIFCEYFVWHKLFVVTQHYNFLVSLLNLIIVVLPKTRVLV